MTERLAIREIVQSLLRQKGDETGFADDDSLIASGRLDSVDTIDLLVFLEQKYGIDFGEHGFDRDVFDSVNSIVAFLGANQLPV